MHGPSGIQQRFDDLPAEYSHLYLAIENELTAVICIEDPLREEARDMVKALKKEGIGKVVMMTGDSARTAASIARRVGVDEYYAEVLPEDKAGFVEREKAAGRRVIMIGDGINDSPRAVCSRRGDRHQRRSRDRPGDRGYHDRGGRPAGACHSEAPGERDDEADPQKLQRHRGDQFRAHPPRGGGTDPADYVGAAPQYIHAGDQPSEHAGYSDRVNIDGSNSSDRVPSLMDELLLPLFFGRKYVLAKHSNICYCSILEEGDAV